jgi:hypothetical protein
MNWLLVFMVLPSLMDSYGNTLVLWMLGCLVAWLLECMGAWWLTGWIAILDSGLLGG